MAETLTNLERPPVVDPDADRAAWVHLLHELAHTVAAWAGEDWQKKEICKPMRDSVLGQYEAPGLLMQHEFTQVILEPIARYAPGCDGVVDLARMPTYDQIAGLYRIGGEWKLYFEFKGTKFIAGPRTAQSLPFDESLLHKVLSEFIINAA